MQRRLNAASVLLGSLGTLVILNALGLQSARGAQAEVEQEPLSVAGIPTWDQMVQIPEGTRFHVPSGRTLVMTGVIAGNPRSLDGDTCVEVAGDIWGVGSFPYRILVNALPAIGGHLTQENDTTTFHWGIPVNEGAVVEIVDEGLADCRPNPGSTIDVADLTILGYLADAEPKDGPRASPLGDVRLR